MPIINDLFETLKNGQWHHFEEISQKTQITRLKLEFITNFLAEYNFIELDKKEHKTRLTPPLLDFIKKIQNINEQEEKTEFIRKVPRRQRRIVSKPSL